MITHTIKYLSIALLLSAGFAGAMEPVTPMDISAAEKTNILDPEQTLSLHSLLIEGIYTPAMQVTLRPYVSSGNDTEKVFRLYKAAHPFFSLSKDSEMRPLFEAVFEDSRISQHDYYSPQMCIRDREKYIAVLCNETTNSILGFSVFYFSPNGFHYGEGKLNPKVKGILGQIEVACPSMNLLLEDDIAGKAEFYCQCLVSHAKNVLQARYNLFKQAAALNQRKDAERDYILLATQMCRLNPAMRNCAHEVGFNQCADKEGNKLEKPTNGCRWLATFEDIEGHSEDKKNK